MKISRVFIIVKNGVMNTSLNIGIIMSKKRIDCVNSHDLMWDMVNLLMRLLDGYDLNNLHNSEAWEDRYFLEYWNYNE